jgi:hypothetical protein
MQPPGTPSTQPQGIARPETNRLRGWRAVIDFVPKPTSKERLCAGIVVRADTGEITFSCAVDATKMEHAFGPIGLALYDVASKLCESLANHWLRGQNPKTWTPPFVGAHLVSLERFSAKDAAEAIERMLNRTSTLHTLLSAYEVQQQKRNASIVERVRSLVKKDVNTKHLAPRFNRKLTVNGEAEPLKVDFLGQRYACYFLQVTQNAKGLEVNTERAYGKLWELQSLRDMVKKPKKSFGLLDEERPSVFELLMVGDSNDPVQRRAIYQVEALADRGKVVMRIESSANSAAERLAHQEKLAA